MMKQCHSIHTAKNDIAQVWNILECSQIYLVFLLTNKLYDFTFEIAAVDKLFSYQDFLQERSKMINQ